MGTLRCAIVDQSGVGRSTASKPSAWEDPTAIGSFQLRPKLSTCSLLCHSPHLLAIPSSGQNKFIFHQKMKISLCFFFAAIAATDAFATFSPRSSLDTRYVSVVERKGRTSASLLFYSVTWIDFSHNAVLFRRRQRLPSFVLFLNA